MMNKPSKNELFKGVPGSALNEVELALLQAGVKVRSKAGSVKKVPLPLPRAKNGSLASFSSPEAFYYAMGMGRMEKTMENAHLLMDSCARKWKIKPNNLLQTPSPYRNVAARREAIGWLFVVYGYDLNTICSLMGQGISTVKIAVKMFSDDGVDVSLWGMLENGTESLD